MERMITRLGLAEYNVDAPMIEEKVSAKQVRIKMNMHIGAKAVPIVHKNDTVQQGDVIAVAEEGKLSLPVHASISGIVLEVNDSQIIIRAKQ
jgi:Na+-translocating ferredoxin:NAD+ oxidoreductase RnfC subunit